MKILIFLKRDIAPCALSMLGVCRGVRGGYMHKTNFLRLAVLVIICTLLFQGCSIAIRLNGKWSCDELEITLDFDDYSIPSDWYTARGEITIDGEVRDIKCRIGPSTFMAIGFDGMSGDLSLRLYQGYIYNYRAGKNTFTLKLDSGEKYVFAKQE